MLDAFYGAFSPACLALLGLWLVVVQVRLGEWRSSPAHRRRAYGIALHFALPGMMSLLALVDPADPAFWRVSFAIVAFTGAIIMILVRGTPLPGTRPDPATPAPRPADRAGLLAYLAAIALYAAIGALAITGGPVVLRVEAVLLTALIFLGFNVAWLLLFDDSCPARDTPPAS